jgi:Mg2+ and Co2+ transporter CorA
MPNSNPQRATTRCQARLFVADAPDSEVACAELARVAPSDDKLLWVDLVNPDQAMLEQTWEGCGLPEAAREFLDAGTSPEVQKEAEWFWLRVVAVVDSRIDDIKGTVLSIIANGHVVVSIHQQEIEFIETLRGREDRHSSIGQMGTDSFVASLLDWQLSTYFDAVSDFEISVERLEVQILTEKARQSLTELQRLRKAASRLRRMLAPHRRVFGALSRPDFRPDESREAERNFGALDTRYERAMDMVENARDLVIGSFELFSNQTALDVNRTMKILTFATVVIGLLATIAGTLGMNFDASFFKARDTGFWIAVGGMATLGLASLAVSRWFKWL